MERRQQKKGERCEKLLEAIEFFSQVLHPDQLVEYGYQYIHQALGLETSLLYMKSEDKKSLYLKGASSCDIDVQRFDLTSKVKTLATKVGVVLSADLAVYLPEELTKKYRPNFLMPLIVADELIGLIVSNDWNETDLEDWHFAEALKKLINNAFYTGMQTEKNRQFMKLMDRKLYDQMLLHQMMAHAITALELDQLIRHCVDGIRELTSSGQTSFCLLEEHSENIVVKHYTDLKYFKKAHGAVVWNANEQAVKMTYSVENDAEALAVLFGQTDLFQRLGAQYVILLKTSPVIGFVTLGQPVSDQVYSQSTFDLIESIMSSICIAIENANHLSVLNDQKKLLNSTVESMTQLAHSIKTVNSAEDLSELSELVFRCMNLFAGIDQALLARRISADTYKVSHSTDEAYIDWEFSLSQKGLEQLEKGLLLDFAENSLGDYLLGFEPHSKGRNTLLAPIDIVHMEEGGIGPRAILVGLNMEHQFLNYEVHYVETLASSVAPVFHQLEQREVLAKAHQKSEEQRFVEALELHETQKQNYWMDYKVYYKRRSNGLFGPKGTLAADRENYRLGNLICCFAYEEELFSEELSEGSLSGPPEDIKNALEVLCG